VSPIPVSPCTVSSFILWGKLLLSGGFVHRGAVPPDAATPTLVRRLAPGLSVLSPAPLARSHLRGASTNPA
jgi:hypothetical protein